MTKKLLLRPYISELPQFRLALNEFLSIVLKDSVQINQIILAIEEACSNNINYGDRPENYEEIEVFISFEKNKLVADIKDNSAPFKIDASICCSMLDKIIKKDKGGLGLTLINKIMDSVETFERGDYYICRMTKVLK
jgi:serine/threonine-protein kinase RsbW